MNIQKIEIGKLNPAQYNPRKDLKPGDAEFEKLKRSIENFGYVEPVIWNSRTGNIVGGHQRFKVLKTLGYTEVDCVVVDLGVTEEKALNVALNKIGGEWDVPLLTDLLQELSASDFDVGLTGFDASELEKMFADGNPKEVKEDDFDLTAALEKAAFVMPQDIWRLGRHTLMCGDSTNATDVERLMDGRKANLLLMDPPYNIGYVGNGNMTIKNDKMDDEKFLNEFLLPSFKCAYDAMSDDATAYVFHADSKGEWFRRAFRLSGFHLSVVCQWVKNSFTLGRSLYQWQNEPCLVGWKVKGTHKWYAGRDQSTTWFFDKPKKNDIHPTMKSLEMLAKPIQNSTAANAIVLDLFSGSFSTGMVCQQLDRICLAMEIDPVYASASIRRFIAEYGADDVTVERNGEILKFTEVRGNG